MPGSSVSAASAAAGSTVGEVLLAVREVSLRLGGTAILDRVSFEVRDRIRPGVPTGQIVGLLGPSGVGKTRLLRIIAGLDAPDSGTVVGPDGQPPRLGTVGVVFQNYPLLRHRTVIGNLIAAGTAAGMGRGEAEAKGRALLGKFRLGDRANLFPAQLSGGQRQRVAIAQQLIRPKPLLLMDEPFSGLDPGALDEVIALLVEVAHLDEANTVIVVTHDIRSAMVVGDTIFMLGRERSEGKPPRAAHVQATYDLVERGLAWQPEVAEGPAFAALEREIRSRFRRL